MKKIEIKNSLDLVEYESAIKLMNLRVKKIQAGELSELIWFLEHDHIYTQGTSANKNEIIKK